MCLFSSLPALQQGMAPETAKFLKVLGTSFCTGSGAYRPVVATYVCLWGNSYAICKKSGQFSQPQALQTAVECLLSLVPNRCKERKVLTSIVSSVEQENALKRNSARGEKVSVTSVCKIAAELENPIYSGTRFDKETLIFCENDPISVSL